MDARPAGDLPAYRFQFCSGGREEGREGGEEEGFGAELAGDW